MSTAVAPGTVRDLAARVQQAISVLSPKWTLWTLKTLQHNGGVMPQSQLHGAMPWIGAGTLSQRLQQMADTGLVEPTASGRATSISVTAAGRATVPVQEALADWGRRHQGVEGAQAGTQYAEEAMVAISRAHTTAVMWALESEAVYPSEIQEHVLPQGFHPSSLYQRLKQLDGAGLVERVGERRNYMYALTEAGRDLGPAYDALTSWSREHLSGGTAAAATPAPALSATRTASTPSPEPQAPAAAQPSPSAEAVGRAKAAALRSTTTQLEFSHKPGPQPAPLILSAAPATSRHR